MDNKAWYKRISTCFWFLLAMLPFIVALIQFIGYHLTFNSGITSASDLITYHSDVSGSFDNILLIFVNNWKNFCFPFMFDLFNNLFSYMNLSGNALVIMSGCFSWFACVYFIELFVDFIVWLPRFFHGLLERGFKKL